MKGINVEVNSSLVVTDLDQTIQGCGCGEAVLPISRRDKKKMAGVKYVTIQYAQGIIARYTLKEYYTSTNIPTHLQNVLDSQKNTMACAGAYIKKGWANCTFLVVTRELQPGSLNPADYIECNTGGFLSDHMDRRAPCVYTEEIIKPTMTGVNVIDSKPDIPMSEYMNDCVHTNKKEAE